MFAGGSGGPAVGAEVSNIDCGDRGTRVVSAFSGLDSTQCDGRGRIAGVGKIGASDCGQTRAGGGKWSFTAGGSRLSAAAWRRDFDDLRTSIASFARTLRSCAPRSARETAAG